MPDLSVLHSLSDGLQKKLGELVIVAIWGGCGYAISLAWKWLRDFQTTRRQAKQSSPVYLAEKQIQLTIAADRVCRWSGAAHVSIYQFHNGQFFSNGDSIQKISMVSEATENNAMARWLPQSQNLPTASFPNLLLAFRDRPHVWLYRDRCEDYEADRYLRERGYSCRLVCLLTGAKGAWLGLLALSFCEGEFTDETLPSLTTLEQFRRDCAAILARS